MADSGLSRRLAPLLLALAVLLAPARCNSADVAATAGGRGTTRRTCAYTVKVKTSCGAASPRRTTDAVSLAFGDAYRNEAHAPRLPNGGGALDRCATDTFRVTGPCGYGVCYLYLRRSGRDGWAPDWVQVVQPGAAGPITATFYFGDPLLDGVWYGHDRCPKASAAAGSSATTKPSAAAVADARPANKSSASPRG
ncbi:hypothetical protein PR202_gb24719 [Eleusine coracana subsp. coracana]|uniref:Uncharacterized protein n=1 Tax=Eleusine coracana subsp. coracana TaxID=191504 RepID=A0AAV5FJF2_ELECO|nr:hypothetical protein QOZ80_5BG0451560 [Eleusine coracana subsp. coracana]GJN35904.1 hypothetical protein PR202_gb24719 [Eleusine coracana subsp. coracana]